MAQIGKGVMRREGTDVALVGYGTMVQTCLAAAEQLQAAGVSASVMDARCAPASMKWCYTLCAFTPRRAWVRAHVVEMWQLHMVSGPLVLSKYGSQV